MMIDHSAGQEFPETPTSDGCCWGAIIHDAAHCTCWTPVYDLEQQPPQTGLVTPMRARMCGDCAYRPGSPERQSDPRAVADPEGLDALVATGNIFWCHQGIRRPTHWEHPDGTTTPGSPMNYCPPKIDGRPYKADGTPADICVGWAARRLKQLGQQQAS